MTFVLMLFFDSPTINTQNKTCLVLQNIFKYVFPWSMCFWELYCQNPTFTKF